MRIVAHLLVGVAILVTSCEAQEAATEKPRAESAANPGYPVSMADFQDEGVFYIYKNEDRIVTSRFQWEKTGRFVTENVLALAGQSVEFKFVITPDADGRFQRIDIEQPQGLATVERDGDSVRISLNEQKVTVSLKPNTVLFENFTPVFMSTAVRRYDRQAGGKQSMPVFVVGSAVVDASLEYLDTVERVIGGRDLTFDRYLFGFPGVDITIWSDKDGKIYMADVPAQRAAYVREGYESLRNEPVTDPLISQPTFEIEEKRGITIPMRDGLELSTDLYFPKTDQPVPVVLIRTPYKKEVSELDGRFYARRGYAVAIQDCRGRFGSPGEWEPFVNEKQDGYDTIEWLAAQPWSNGKIGMIGASYLGWVQWFAASQNPPHLVTIIPNVAPPDPFFNFPYEHGVFFLWGAIWWADIVEKEATGDISGNTIRDITKKKYAQLLRALPVIELDKPVLGKENKFWRTWIQHNTSDDYWDRASFLDELGDVNIPVFHQSGWFDGDGIGSKLNYAKMVSFGHGNQKLVLGPWGHQAEASRKIGDWDFGPEAAIDLPREYLRWFDHWLKGIDNGVEREPLVRIFAMNSNVWLEGPVYPLPETKFESWHLASHGAANTSNGDGRLVRDAPSANSPPDRFQYDPGDPTPSPSYREQSEDEDKIERSQDERRRIAKDHHESVTSTRKDILVYETDPFESDYTIAGPISATLYASTSAKDTDWFVRLLLVEEDGDITQLVEGRLRARFRDSVKHPTLLEPNKVHELLIDMWQTGVTVQKGMRLRVEVASASFPFFSRNLNTGGHNEMETEYIVADQTVYHDAERPSHITLPIVPLPK